jgi:hypothetical protein
VNRPRVFCPQCSGAARRLYYRDLDETKGTWESVVAWAYCPKCGFCFQHEKDEA